MDNEVAGGTSNSTFESFSGSAMDLDFVDELLYDGRWLRTTDAVNFQQLLPSEACNCGDSSQPGSFLETNGGHLNMDPNQQVFYQEVTENNFAHNSSNNLKMEGDAKTGSQIWRSIEPPMSLVQPVNFSSEKGETGSGLWIGQRGNLVGPSSVKERLRYALKQLREFTKDRDILIQIWVPVRKGNMNVLTTVNQPYFHNPKYKSLASYRNVSKKFQFPAEGQAKDFIGLPGRVYLGKMPEETPDVRFFRNEEYPRKDHAKQYNISGSFAVPVFERGSWSCLGVVEVVTTTQKISYRPEIENICQALESVELRASQDFCPPSVKACKEFCQDAAPEISQILEFVCRAHCLPLALTWAPCFLQGKGGCRHFDEKYANSIATVDSACFVADKSLLPFHVACSEQYLFLGQGIVGKAFTTNKQCFSSDVTDFSKTEYPFSHHAKLFGLHAAVAIPLRSTYNGPADFVLELFLPKDCVQKDEQKRMWDLLPIAIKETCQSLNVVLEKEPDENATEPIIVPSGERPNEEETQKLTSTLSREPQPDESSWIAHMMDAQRKGKGVCVSLNCPKEETTEPFKVTTDWDNPPEESHGGQIFTHLGHLQPNSGSSGAIDIAGAHSIGNKKSGEKKRTKTEKTISLQVLRQYFAGSLKDAAKSLGVCPTTLKRICRQHGITRWPSRKIKKVGHSLKKLQLVIDSVQGAEGAIQIGSFYSTFPELSAPHSGKGNFSSFVTNNDSEQLNRLPGSGQFGGGPISSKSNSSSSQSSGSSICCSTGVRRHANTGAALATKDPSMLEDPGAALKRTFSNIELHALNREETKVLARSQSHMTFAEHPGIDSLPLNPKGSIRNFDDGTKFKVKATYRDDKIRFSLLPDWGFTNFQLEIAKRFNIEDVTRIDLKYLDDDQEWVLLTCNDDLEECKDIYRMSKSRTIKVAVQQASQPHIGSLNSRGPS